jgi:hypothetical protein
MIHDCLLLWYTLCILYVQNTAIIAFNTQPIQSLRAPVILSHVTEISADQLGSSNDACNVDASINDEIDELRQI